MTGTRLAAAVALALLGACRGVDSQPTATPTTTTPTVVASASPLVDPGASTTSTAPARVAAGARPGATTSTHRPTTTTVAGAVTTTSTTALRSTGPKCPDARTCDVYKVRFDQGWRPGPDGVARIPVSINPTPPAGSSLTADTVEADILAMMAVWEEASPTVRFRYLGRTTREPRIGDGHSDLAYGHSVKEGRDIDGYLVEADVTRTPANSDGVGSYPCDWHRDDACGNAGAGKNDTRNLIAHELGHVLGAADLDSSEADDLTMRHHANHPVGDRRRVTLGLGDVLAVRHLYPCGCPLPRIYVP